MDTLRLGGPTHTRWLGDLHALNTAIADAGAFVTDPEDGWVGVDPAKLPAGVAELYANHIQVGAWNGWLAA